MIEAYGENVIAKKVEKEDEETTKSGLILVSDFDEDLPRAIIASKGPDVPEWVNIGDKIVFHGQFAATIESDGEEFVSLNYKTIYGREV